MAHHAGEPIFLIGAEGIDREEVLRVIRKNATRRLPLPHAAAALCQARMHEERQELLDGLRELKAAMSDYGLVDTRRPGWLGAIELSVKRGIRKLFLRHILQQHRVHLKLAKFLGRVITYLEVYDQSLRKSIDQCELEKRSPSCGNAGLARRETSLPTTEVLVHSASR